VAVRGSIRVRRKKAQQPRESRVFELNLDPRQLAIELAPLLSPQRPASPTLAALAEEWLPRKTAGIASGRSMDGRVRKWLLPFLGHHTDQTLRRKDVESWTVELAAQVSARNKPLGKQTIRHAWDAGRQLVNDARANGEWAGANPFEDSGAPAVPHEERETLTAEEVGRALLMVPPLWVSLFATAIYLGPRRGGLRMMRKADVDRRRWTVWLPADKTSKRRCVPVPDELQPFVRFALAINTSSEWLFTDEGGAQLAPDVRLCPKLREALRCIGLKKHLTFHDLRRVSSTLHQEAGCHPWVVSRILGHAQANLVIPDNTTSRRYTKFGDDFVRAELNRLKLFHKESP
jgi:integrase